MTVPPGCITTELVSVVIPMYNAASTIDATLLSVRGQSWSNLEIVVVDDGSTDGSPFKADAHAALDPRLRVVHKPNGGVASARNLGAREARGKLLAFVDADDLWHPEKIALQVEALRSGSPQTGLVYTWFSVIDAQGAIVSEVPGPEFEGDVRRALCRRNFIGNGSSCLITREAFEKCGGYDPTLWEMRSQGCEDFLIALRIAQDFEFRVVPRHLTGYRVVPNSMSSDVRQMIRSFEMVRSRYSLSHPEYAGEFAAHRVDMHISLSLRAWREGHPRDALFLTRRVLEFAKLVGVRQLLIASPRFARALVPKWIKAAWQAMTRRMSSQTRHFIYGISMT